MQIDSIKQGTREPPPITLDGSTVASTVAVRAAIETTGARVGCTQEHEVGWKLTYQTGSGENDMMILKNLPERLSGSAVKLR
jgi:hypothetical protein